MHRNTVLLIHIYYRKYHPSELLLTRLILRYLVCHAHDQRAGFVCRESHSDSGNDETGDPNDYNDESHYNVHTITRVM